MRPTGLVAALAAALVFVAAQGTFAGEPPALKRGVKDGVFVDEYLGLRLKADGLVATPGTPKPHVVLAASATGGVALSIQVGVVPRVDLAKVRAGDVEVLKKQQKVSSVEHGDAPNPWVSFTQEGLGTGKRHVAVAYYGRGHQVFMVNASAEAKSESTLAHLKSLAHKLEVDPETRSFVYAHLIAAQTRSRPDDPDVMFQAASAYLTGQQPIPPVGLALLEVLDKMELEAPDRFKLHRLFGIAYGELGRYKDSIAAFEQGLKQADSQNDPDAARCDLYYNLACCYSLMGDLDKSYANLKKAFEHDAWDFMELRAQAKTDKTLANLRKDPRFKKVYEEVPVK